MAWREIDGFDAQSLIDALPYYVLLVDEDHIIWMANHAVRRTLKVNPEDLVGKRCPDVVHECNSPLRECPLRDAIASGSDVEKEFVDEASGTRVLSCVYDTGYHTPHGRKLFLHTTQPAPCRQA